MPDDSPKSAKRSKLKIEPIPAAHEGADMPKSAAARKTTRPPQTTARAKAPAKAPIAAKPAARAKAVTSPKAALRRKAAPVAENAAIAPPATTPIAEEAKAPIEAVAPEEIAVETAGGADLIDLDSAVERAEAEYAAEALTGGAPIEESADEEESDDQEEPEFPVEPAPKPKLERLQKILSQAGISSRRKAETLIEEGRVQVNGTVVTELGTKADAGRDHIRVDGKLLHGAERLRYFVLNKPKGFVTTVKDPEGRPTVMQFFEKMRERLYPVGRLDYLSEGLLLVTNDGELANRLTKAGSKVEKAYLVKVSGQPTEDELNLLRTGVAIERDKPGSHMVRTAPARIRQVREGDNPWFEVVLIEGRNRELRKMFSSIGHFVEKIRRVGYGPLVLDVEPGLVRELDAEEIEALRLTAEGKQPSRKIKDRYRELETAESAVLPARTARPRSAKPEGAGYRPAGKTFRPAGKFDRPAGNIARPAGGFDRPAGKFERPARPDASFRDARPPRREFPQGDRPRFDRPGSGRDFGGSRPAGGEQRPGPGRSGLGQYGPGRSGPGRPASGRTASGRFGENRGQDRPAQRPMGTGSRPSFDRPAGSRPAFDRPGGSRPPFNRSAGSRPTSERGPARPRFDKPGFEKPRFERDSRPAPRFDSRGAGPSRPPRAEGELARPFTTSSGKPRAGGARPSSKPFKPGGHSGFKPKPGGFKRPFSPGGDGPKTFGAKPAAKRFDGPSNRGTGKPSFSRPKPGGGSGFKPRPGGGKPRSGGPRPGKPRGGRPS